MVATIASSDVRSPLASMSWRRYSATLVGYAPRCLLGAGSPDIKLESCPPVKSPILSARKESESPNPV